MTRLLPVWIGCAALLAASAAAAPAESVDPLAGHQGKRVVAVELRGHRQVGLTRAEGLSFVAVQPGDRFSLRAVRRSVKLLYHLGLFGQVRVTARPAAGGLRLIFDLSPKRRVLAVEVYGCEAVDARLLLRQSRLERGDEYDHWKMEAGAADMRELYARRGYRRARIVSKAEQDDSGDVWVRHFIQEGAPTRISRLWFRGRPRFDRSRLERVIGLERGAVLNQERLEAGMEALRDFYREQGYCEARVRGPQLDLGLEARWEVVPIDVEPGPRIAFAFVGNRVFDDAQLRDALALEENKRLDDYVLADLRQRLADRYRGAGYARVRVGSRVEHDRRRRRKRITFVVREGPRVTVRAMEFVGNQAFDDDALRAYVADAMVDAVPQPALGQPVDPGDMDPLGGHPAVGRPRPVDRPQGFLFELVPERIYLRRPVHKALEDIEDLYLSRGYLGVRLEPPVLSYSDDGADLYLSFPVHEGPQTRVESIAFSGNQAIPAESLLAVADRLERFVKPGGPLDQYGVELLRKELARSYAKRGYVFCRVRQDVAISGDRRRADVVYHFDEGPSVRVGRVLLRGNLLTDEKVFRALLQLRPGELFTPEKVAASQEGLLELGVFSGVDVKMLEPDRAEATKDVVVHVRERLGHHLTLAPGISSGEGVRMLLGYTHRNLFGYALESVNRARVNYQVFYPTGLVPAALSERFDRMPFYEGLEWNLMSGLHWPRMWFVGRGLTGRLDLAGLRDHALSFDLTKVSITPGVDFDWAEELAATIEYEIEYIELSCPFKGAQAAVDAGPCGDSPSRWIRYDEGRLPLGSFRPELSWDHRDNPFDPHRGLLMALRVELAHTLSPARPVCYLKLDGQVTGYLPVTRRTTLALSIRAGALFHLLDDSRTPSHKLFYLGGRNSVRGFGEENLIPADQAEACFCAEEAADGSCIGKRTCVSQGGNSYLTLKAEYRFPLLPDLLSGALFVDVGNLWVETGNFDPFDLRPVAGLGLRLATPIGPLAIDAGFNLMPDESRGESPWNLHFNVGVF